MSVRDVRRPSLLVIRPTGLGDLVMALPALRALRRAHPYAELVTTCPSSLVELAGLAGVVDRFVTEDDTTRGDPSTHKGREPALFDRLFAEPERGADETVAVLKMPVADLARRSLARRPREVLCFRHPDVPESAGLPAYDAEEHVLARWERLLAPAGIAPDRDDLYLTLPGTVGDPGDAPTVVHLGAGSVTRRWPAERWTEVVRGLAGDGHRIVFTGSAGERAGACAVAAAAGLGEDCVVAGGGSAIELARTVRSARLVLGTDTGVPHLAVLFGRPSVTLFGPTPPTEWGPPPGSRGHRVLWAGTTGPMYGARIDPGLLRISAAQVLAAAREIDADPGRTGPDGPVRSTRRRALHPENRARHR